MLPPIIGMLFCVVGYFLVRHTMRNKETGVKDSLGILVSSKRIIIGLLFMLVGFLVFILTLNITDYFNTRKIYKESKFQITQGYVNGTKVELGKFDYLNFYINGIHFQLTSNNVNDYGCGFQDIPFREITDSTYLRVSYFSKNDKNIILKIEKSNSH